MSIFKDTLKKEVYDQIKARQSVISGENNSRSTLLPWYLSKNAWVRMTSFVDYQDGIVDFPGKGTVTILPNTGVYNGQDLARKYILQGGALYTQENGGKTLAALRKGIGGDGSAYGSDIDFQNGNKSDKYFRTYGIRPMPGITSVDMKTINAYGSIYESTVKFYAWDIQQLNELEVLFMRPGYSVLLEWGWSQYVDNDGSSKVFLGRSINPFESGLTIDKIYNQLEGLRKKHDYNYDGMLGYVKNFSWTMLDNGGYECTTSIISMGEVMNTLRMTPASQNFPQPNSSTLSVTPKSYYDDYERVLLSIKYKSEYNSNQTINESEYLGKFTESNKLEISKIQADMVSAGYAPEADNLNQEPYIKPLKVNQEGRDNYGNNFEFISTGTWMGILGTYFKLKAEVSSEMVKIIPPFGTDYCLAGRDSISSDLSVCAVKNSLAYPEFRNFRPEGYTQDGIDPMLYQNTNYSNVEASGLASIQDFYDDSIKAGRLKDIYLNIDLLLDEYRSLRSKSIDTPVMIEYITSVMGRVGKALGGINDFKLTTASRDQNILKIYDNFYLEQKSRSSSKVKLDIFGLNSIFKDVKINSKIFPEQSTMIAIAAQSRANLGTIYNTSQVYLNAGITDRLAPTKYQGNENQILEANSSDPTYQKLTDFLVYIRNAVVGDSVGGIYKADPTLPTEPASYSTQFLLKFDGEVGFKALIPFTLTLKLEGLGGFVIGQIFTINKNILPQNYADKNLGFIITRIFHRLENNQWETTLETQICLLDQQEFYDAKGISKLTNNINREAFDAALLPSKIEGIIYPILVDFFTYQSMRVLAGYLYASAANVNSKPIIDKLTSGEYLTSKTELNNTKTDVQRFWEQNVLYFLDPKLAGRPASTSKTFATLQKYDLDQFEEFTKDWIAKYKSDPNNASTLSSAISSDTSSETVEQVLDRLTTTESFIRIDQTFKLQKTLQSYPDKKLIEADRLGEPVQHFWPSGKPSVFSNDPKELRKIFIKYKFNQSTDNEFYRLNNDQILSNVKTSLASDSNYSDLITKWNTLTLADGSIISSKFSPLQSKLFPFLDLTSNASFEVYGNTIDWGTPLIATESTRDRTTFTTTINLAPPFSTPEQLDLNAGRVKIVPWP